jgi:hypothetical protein
MTVSLRISQKVEFSKTLMNPKVIYGQNEHNNEHQKKYLVRELCEYYCFDLHKRLNSSRHCIHYLAF